MQQQGGSPSRTAASSTPCGTPEYLFYSKVDLLSWVNDVLRLSLRRLEQVGGWEGGKAVVEPRMLRDPCVAGAWAKVAGTLLLLCVAPCARSLARRRVGRPCCLPGTW